MAQIKNNQSEEDYLEALLILQRELPVVHRIDVAKKLSVSQAAVNKAVNLLLAKEYLYEDGKHIFLTQGGKKYAEKVYEKHRILREFLLSLGVSEAVAEEDACKMEHLVSDETFSAIKKSLVK